MPTRLVAREPREKFEDPEGLRALLDRLHAAGRGSWRADPEAAALDHVFATVARSGVLGARRGRSSDCARPRRA